MRLSENGDTITDTNLYARITARIFKTGDRQMYKRAITDAPPAAFLTSVPQAKTLSKVSDTVPPITGITLPAVNFAVFIAILSDAEAAKFCIEIKIPRTVVRSPKAHKTILLTEAESVLRFTPSPLIPPATAHIFPRGSKICDKMLQAPQITAIEKQREVTVMFLPLPARTLPKTGIADCIKNSILSMAFLQTELTKSRLLMQKRKITM